MEIEIRRVNLHCEFLFFKIKYRLKNPELLIFFFFYFLGRIIWFKALIKTTFYLTNRISAT